MQVSLLVECLLHATTQPHASGKILTDDNALSEYNIDEKKFIVVMVTKPKLPEKSDSGDASTVTTTSRLEL